MMTIIALSWIYPEKWVGPAGWNEHALRARGFKEQKQAGKLWFSGAFQGPYSLASVSISLSAYQEVAFV